MITIEIPYFKFLTTEKLKNKLRILYSQMLMCYIVHQYIHMHINLSTLKHVQNNKAFPFHLKKYHLFSPQKSIKLYFFQLKDYYNN